MEDGRGNLPGCGCHVSCVRSRRSGRSEDGIAGAVVIGKGTSASVAGSAGVDALAALVGWLGCNTGGKAEKGCHLSLAGDPIGSSPSVVMSGWMVV